MVWDVSDASKASGVIWKYSSAALYDGSPIAAWTQCLSLTGVPLQLEIKLANMGAAIHGCSRPRNVGICSWVWLRRCEHGVAAAFLLRACGLILGGCDFYSIIHVVSHCAFFKDLQNMAAQERTINALKLSWFGPSGRRPRRFQDGRILTRSSGRWEQDLHGPGRSNRVALDPCLCEGLWTSWTRDGRCTLAVCEAHQATIPRFVTPNASNQGTHPPWNILNIVNDVIVSCHQIYCLKIFDALVFRFCHYIILIYIVYTFIYMVGQVWRE